MIWGKDFGQLLTGTASRNWKLACSKTVNQIQNTFDSWILTRLTVLADSFFVCAGVVDDNCSLVFHPSSGPCKQQIRGYQSQQLTIHLWAINGSTGFHILHSFTTNITFNVQNFTIVLLLSLFMFLLSEVWIVYLAQSLPENRLAWSIFLLRSYCKSFMTWMSYRSAGVSAVDLNNMPTLLQSGSGKLHISWSAKCGAKSDL